MTNVNKRKASHDDLVNKLSSMGHTDPVAQQKIGETLSDDERGGFIQFLEMLGATPAQAEQAADEAQGKPARRTA